jgi:glycosyltransferase involved in cell wall biosynthesis
MRILLIAPETLDMHTKRLIQMLLNARYEITFVAPVDPFPTKNTQYEFIKYPQFHLPGWFRPYRLKHPLVEFIYILFFRYLWWRTHPDVVHVIYIGQGAYYCARARLSPMILTALGSDINDPYDIEDPAWRSRTAATLKAASHITADTPELLMRSEVLAGTPLACSLFYFGIDLKLFYPRDTVEIRSLKQRLTIPLDALVVLSPRRLTSKMRHDLVLQAFAKFVKDGGFNARLIFKCFGYFSADLQDELQKLTVEFELQQQVIWLDELPYEEIPTLYSLADVVINIPEQDGLPVTLLEASACKVPILTSDLPAYQEFMNQGSYYRVSLGDVNEIACTLKMIVQNKGQAMTEELQKNYDLVARCADQEICFAGLEKIYRDVQHHSS